MVTPQTRVTQVIIRGVREGYSVRQIAEALGAHEDTILGIIADLGPQLCAPPAAPCQHQLCGQEPRAGRYPAGFVTIRQDPEPAVKFCGWPCASRYATRRAS